jgi:DNA repair photolyase
VNIGKAFCKSIMNRSGIKGVDYAINPYTGCGHSCKYCYARFMTRWVHQGEEWGSFVDAKLNAVECLKNEAPRKRRGVVLLSSVTDPYQPAEKIYKITREILGVLCDYDFPVQILTKSSLITRDLEVITEIEEMEVGLTITCMNDSVRRAFEPGASTIYERLEALRVINEVGVPTYAFLGPLLPFLSEDGLGELLSLLADRVNRVIVDRLNIKAGNWLPINRTLERYNPQIIPRFKEAAAEGSAYYEGLKRDLIIQLYKRAIPFDILF